MTFPDAPFPVTIEPEGLRLECMPGETLIACAWRHGYYWPTICGGVGECGACRCEVLAGSGCVSSIEGNETVFFRNNPVIRQRAPEMRLACCMTVTGPVTVLKRSVVKR